jgi:hypothetical protein
MERWSSISWLETKQKRKGRNMKNFMILIAIVLVVGIAQASSRVQVSANIISAVLKSILSDQGLADTRITKVFAGSAGVRVEFIGHESCLSAFYGITHDRSGHLIAIRDNSADTQCE